MTSNVRFRMRKWRRINKSCEPRGNEMWKSVMRDECVRNKRPNFYCETSNTNLISIINETLPPFFEGVGVEERGSIYQTVSFVCIIAPFPRFPFFRHFISHVLPSFANLLAHCFPIISCARKNDERTRNSIFQILIVYMYYIKVEPTADENELNKHQIFRLDFIAWSP